MNDIFHYLQKIDNMSVMLNTIPFLGVMVRA